MTSFEELDEGIYNLAVADWIDKGIWYPPNDWKFIIINDSLHMHRYDKAARIYCKRHNHRLLRYDDILIIERNKE